MISTSHWILPSFITCECCTTWMVSSRLSPLARWTTVQPAFFASVSRFLPANRPL
jgi:hypothetical protein